MNTCLYLTFRRALSFILLCASPCLPTLCRAAVGLTLNPSSISNTYGGLIALQITGLTNGETVVVQKFLDVNTNGVIDEADLLVQQFNLTDGQASAIGGVTNFNVAGDTGTTAGQITAQLSFQNGDFVQNIVGNYAFELSSPSGHFAPITNSFNLTNVPYAQRFTGDVVNSGTNVPNAVVILFPPPRPGHGPGTPKAATVANNSGNYTIQAPAGTYSLLAFKSNYVADFTTAPLLTLGDGATINTNLTLTNATLTISGKIVDANNSSIGLPGLFLPFSANGLVAVGFTDADGNFTVPVRAGQWDAGGNSSGLIVHGYVGLNNDTTIDATTGSVSGVTIALPKATTLFYGSVKDNFGNPLTGVSLFTQDGNNQYEQDAYTDVNGNYLAGALTGTWRIQVDNNQNSSLANYIFSQSPLNQNGGTNLTAGKSVLQNFTAILAPHHITGHVQDNNGNPIFGVQIFGSANINGANYQTQANTDSSGNYSLNVPNGNWSVNVCCGCNDCDNCLSSAYQCPNSQNVNIVDNNGTVNISVQLCSGVQITTTSPLPNGQVGNYYSLQFQAASCNNNFTWSVNDPAHLPPGLTLYSGGAFNGTPTASATFNFTVHVSDGKGNSTDQPFLLLINPSVSGLQVTITGDSGPGSLRQAILNANANPGLETITFNIAGAGVHTITPTSPLPTITDPVNIDGTTQPGFAGKPLIELNGSSAGSSAWGLDITAGNSTVRGLAINRFGLDGIHLSMNGGNVIQGNFIGADPIGTNALGNSGSGVTVESCANNLIGGTAPGQGNLLSGNGFAASGNADGLNFNSNGASNNMAQGNLIGTDITGTKALPNARSGIVIWHGANNTIGGTAAGARNVIAGNVADGISITEADAKGNLVQGNYIGTTASGAVALGNGSGISLIGGASGNTIGGTSTAARNLISGNTNNGVSIRDANTAANLVLGNLIGTDATGTLALGNGSGVNVSAGASGNTIGGTSTTARNVISGNANNGVLLTDANTTGNVIAGNFIGTDLNGSADLGNTGNGVLIRMGASFNSVGTANSGAGNVLSGNGGRGVFVRDPGTSSNVISGNFIGTDATGTKILRNDLHGVSLALGASGTTVGGTSSAARNLLSGNGVIGVLIGDSANNVVQGNYIGTDFSGTTALPNQAGGVGIQQIDSATTNNLIGGPAAGARNIIAGNGGEGVYLYACARNFIQGNSIGLGVTGAGLVNYGSGVYIEAGTNNLVGGASSGQSNLIAFNQAGAYSSGDGVTIQSGNGNAIQGNSIYSNAGLGIALGVNGVVLNDPGDADSGPNNQQNFPVISSAANTSSNTIVQGALNSAANTTFLIELFSNNTADPGGFGEGQTFLGRAAVTTAADGTIAFTTAFTPSIPLGRLITGTATDPAGNTSQFSAATPVVTQILLSGVTTPEPGQFRLSFNTAAGTNYTIQFSTTLTNWATLFVTNAPTGSFSVVDPNATNACRFYRVLLGP